MKFLLSYHIVFGTYCHIRSLLHYIRYVNCLITALLVGRSQDWFLVVSWWIFSMVPLTEPCDLKSTQPLKVSTRDLACGKGGQCVSWQMTTPVMPKRQEIRGLRLPRTPWATTACHWRPLLLLWIVLYMCEFTISKCEVEILQTVNVA